MSFGEVLVSVLNYNETSYVYTFEDEVQYCQILIINITAVSALGPSVPGLVSRGFPIGENFWFKCLFSCMFNFLNNMRFLYAYGRRDREQEVIILYCIYINLAPHQFNMDIDVDVTFLRNGTPMASITFEVNYSEQSNKFNDTMNCCCRLHLFVTIRQQTTHSRSRILLIQEWFWSP